MGEKDGKQCAIKETISRSREATRMAEAEAKLLLIRVKIVAMKTLRKSLT